ncbi:MAG: nucleotidyltransferase family protein [Geminicoccaceae bacterium]
MKPSLLVQVLRDPSLARDFDAASWDRLLRQARAATLVGKLGLRLREVMSEDDMPPAIRRATRSALVIAAKIHRDILLELYVLRELFADMSEPIILLKGTGYLSAGLSIADGRVFGDIDILVPRTTLALVEERLKTAGWSFGAIDAYDESYYRRWTHELPPLEHLLRGTLVDVHHAILQERESAPAARTRMIADARLLDERFAVLQPVDMVLHACAHLFTDGEFDKGLRDLFDIVTLVRDFAASDSGFWDRLLERSADMRLRRPLFYALDQSVRLFGLEVPASVFRGLAEESRFNRFMQPVLHRGLMPHHASAADRLTAPSLIFLYIRAHYLRMPLLHLAMHLIRKAFRRETAPETPPIPGAPPAPQRG